MGPVVWQFFLNLKGEKSVLLHNKIKTDTLEDHSMSPLPTYFSRRRKMSRSNFMFYQTIYAEFFLVACR